MEVFHIKKNIVFIISIFLIIVIVLLFILNNKNDIDNNITVKLKNIEVYSETYLSDVIDITNVTLDKNDKIDTTKLGTKQILFKYKNKDNQSKKAKIKVNIVDTTPPVVMLNNTYSIVKGNDSDLTKIIFFGDNYDKNSTSKIEGKYNSNEIGEYSLTFIVSDSSNNVTKIPFTLKVIEKSVTKTTTTNFKDIVDKHKTSNTEIGIDVSKWQGKIDFSKVKQRGASFVMIRLGYQSGFDGEYKLDPYFIQNIEGALEAGLKVGVYFYSYATTKKEAIDQAEFIIKNIKEYNIELPIAFDWESFGSFTKLNLSFYDINTIANTFMKEIENSNYTPILYGSKNYLEKVWSNETYKTWLAHYTSSTTYEGEYFIWQLCNNGRIDGINGNVDIDIMYK